MPTASLGAAAAPLRGERAGVEMWLAGGESFAK
jgi:hypothetical protein